MSEEKLLPRLGSAAIVEKDGRVLLGVRNKEPESGKWVLPGGKVEPFESFEDAVKRELLEETGLEIDVGEQLGVYEIIAPPDEHRVIVYSRAMVKSGELRSASDSSNVRFFSKDELAGLNVTPFVRRVLRDAGWL